MIPSCTIITSGALCTFTYIYTFLIQFHIANHKKDNTGRTCTYTTRHHRRAHTTYYRTCGTKKKLAFMIIIMNERSLIVTEFMNNHRVCFDCARGAVRLTCGWRSILFKITFYDLPRCAKHTFTTTAAHTRIGQYKNICI